MKDSCVRRGWATGPYAANRKGEGNETHGRTDPGDTHACPVAHGRRRGEPVGRGVTRLEGLSERLFEFDIQRVLLSTYKKRGEPNNWPPIYQKWHDGSWTTEGETRWP